MTTVPSSSSPEQARCVRCTRETAAYGATADGRTFCVPCYERAHLDAEHRAARRPALVDSATHRALRELLGVEPPPTDAQQELAALDNVCWNRAAVRERVAEVSRRARAAREAARRKRSRALPESRSAIVPSCAACGALPGLYGKGEERFCPTCWRERRAGGALASPRAPELVREQDPHSQPAAQQEHGDGSLLTQFRVWMQTCTDCGIYASNVRKAKGRRPEELPGKADVAAAGYMSKKTLERRESDHYKKTGHRWPPVPDVWRMLKAFDAHPED